MLSIFNTIINTLVRDISYPVRCIIAAVFFLLAVLTLIWSIRKKNDKYPIAWGWMILSVISLALTVVYIAL